MSKSPPSRRDDDEPQIADRDEDLAGRWPSEYGHGAYIERGRLVIPLVSLAPGYVAPPAPRRPAIARRDESDVSRPQRLTARSLASKFVAEARSRFPQSPVPPNEKRLGGQFAQWTREGITLEQIDTMIDLFMVRTRVVGLVPLESQFTAPRMRGALLEAAKEHLRYAPASTVQKDKPETSTEDVEYVQFDYRRPE